MQPRSLPLHVLKSTVYAKPHLLLHMASSELRLGYLSSHSSLLCMRRHEALNSLSTHDLQSLQAL